MNKIITKNELSNIFKNKKVIITGHTGFKGSWLALWLNLMGAKVYGISKNIPTEPSHFKVIKLKYKLKNYFFDICNYKKLDKTINKIKPDFIFHLAAQSLVKKSYSNTLETWNTNTIGTLNLLESLKTKKKKICVVLITSDKSYKNLELKRGYKETDILGGKDPYSASKGSAELAIQSYIDSFFSNKKNNIFISIARAGNVIGGGDWSNDRIIPDCVRSYSKNKVTIIRSPFSTRPWQHVIEVVYGYLVLASKLYKNRKLHGESFNFGPNRNANYEVQYLLRQIKKFWPNFKWKVIKKQNKFFESKLLQLNSNKAKKILNWRSIMTIDKTAKLISNWYSTFYDKKRNNLYFLSEKQIKDYILQVSKK